MIDDDFCDDAEEWKQIADSYAYELEDREDRIEELQARIEQLEAALEDVVQYLPRADWYNLKDKTLQSLKWREVK